MNLKNSDDKISLYGFNNLTKNLSFSLYKLHYLADADSQDLYNQYISDHFNANKLKEILSGISDVIGGNILSIAQQDYQPQGASVTLMISEEIQPQSLVAHLDKSHLCVHTYPEDKPKNGIAVFRADIELSTCGVISPLKVINSLIEAFDVDIAEIDFRIRGMTRNHLGNMLFNDGEINNISDFLSEDIFDSYQLEETNSPKLKLYHTRLIRKDIHIDNCVFKTPTLIIPEADHQKITDDIKSQLQQIFFNHAD